jgi:hypothetical protein
MDLSILKAPVPAAPPPPGQVSDFDHPLDEQRNVQMLVTLAIVVAFSTVCAVMRLWTRAVIIRHFGWDDCTLCPRLRGRDAPYVIVTNQWWE